MQQTVVGTRSVPRAIALTTVLAVLFLTFLDTTIVTVALGSIQYNLGAGVIPLQWVVNSYSLVFASLMLLRRLARRPAGAQVADAGRHRGVLRRLGDVRARPRHRLVDRRARRDGRGRGGVRAGHALGDPAPVPGP